MQKHRFSTKHMVIIAFLAAILCIVAPFSIPVGAVPVSLMTLIIYIMCYIVPGRIAFAAYTVYFLLGLVGLPVFSGFSGGIGKLAGPTGGYLLGAFFLIPICGFTLKDTAEHKMRNFLGMLFATIVMYSIGIIWFMLILSCNFYHAFTVCVLPFVLIDIAKILLAVCLGPMLQRRIRKTTVSLLF